MCPSFRDTVLLQSAVAITAGKESVTRAWEKGGGYSSSQIQILIYREKMSGTQSWVMGEEGCLG